MCAISHCPQSSSLVISQSKRSQRKSYIPISAELAANFTEDSNWLKSKALMKRECRGVWQRVAGDDAVNVLTRDRFKKRAVQAAANPAT